VLARHLAERYNLQEGLLNAIFDKTGKETVNVVCRIHLSTLVSCICVVAVLIFATEKYGEQQFSLATSAQKPGKNWILATIANVI